MIWIRLSWVILIGSVAWFKLIMRWIDRNPTYAEQVRNHEAPYPWFFNVQVVLFFTSIPAIFYIAYYYILRWVFK